MSTDPGGRRAWGWLAHLREGGTTPWHEWSGEAEARGRLLPGAQQLELLRRLNVAAAAAGSTPGAQLARRVLEASAPGRGRPDLELVGAAPPRRFGPPPVDPADLPLEELTRVATSLLAEDCAAAGVPAGAVPRPSTRLDRRIARRVRRRFGRHSYRLVGDPWLADPAREALVARGRPPGGRAPTVLVVGTDLATMLTDAWRHRVLTDGAPPWRDWLADTVARDRVPPRVDVLTAARTWAGRVGPQRVRLVLDPAALPGLTGTRRPLPGPPTLGADGAELARRTGSVLGLLARPDRRAALLRHTLLPRLSAAGGEPLVVPGEHAAWVARRAAEMLRAARSAGYAVTGDLDALLPRPATPAGAEQPSEEGVLRLAVHLLLERRAAPDPTSPTEDR